MTARHLFLRTGAVFSQGSEKQHSGSAAESEAHVYVLIYRDS